MAKEFLLGDGAIIGGAMAEAPVVAPFPIAVLLLEVEDQPRELVVDALAMIVCLDIGGLLRHLAFKPFCISLDVEGDLYLLEDHGKAKHGAERDQPVRLFLFAVVEGLLLAV